MFVAVGANGAIVTSADGVTWASKTSGVTKTLYAVNANASIFVAVGEGGTILTSSNGAVWAAKTSKTTSDLHGIAWSGSIFVAVGADSAVVTSPDGSAWTRRTFGTSTAINGVTWGNNKFVAVGFDDMGATVNTSPNGTTWTQQTADEPDGLLSVAWCGNAFIAVSSAFVVSKDGITWANYSPDLENFIFGITGHANRSVAVGAQGTIMSSPDDTTWTTENSNVAVNLNGVTWGNNLFVAVGEAGTILTSPVTSGIADRRQTINHQGPGMTIDNHGVGFSLFADATVTMRLYSMHGRLVRSISGMMLKGEHAISLPSGLAQGRYLVSFQAGGRTIEKPVLIVR
jgi:hypothetical protein